MPRMMKHPMQYNSRYAKGGYETAYAGGEEDGLVGSKYKASGSSDLSDMGTKWDKSSWTPYGLLEAAAMLFRLSLVFMALWQLCRHTVFSNGIWYGLYMGQLIASGIFAVFTFFAVYKNYQVRLANVQLNKNDVPIVDSNGAFQWKNPDAVHKLPEVRCGLFWLIVVAGGDAAVFTYVYLFWKDNISTPLDCIDQRQSDRNMWLIVVMQTFASTEAIAYFFNFLVYMARKAMGHHASLVMDL